MNPAQQKQRLLKAEVNALLKKNRVVVRETIPSTTAVLVGNFIVSKSIISPFLKRLGYERNKKVTGVGRLYFKVNNFVEIILALYYLYILAPKLFKKIAKDPFAVIDGIVKNKISISSPMTSYLEFRNMLYHKRLMSMGESDYNKNYVVRDRLWIKDVKVNTARQLIASGEASRVNPAIVCIALIEHDLHNNLDFELYRDRNAAVIHKAFIQHHYIRSMLSRISCKFTDRYDELVDILGFTHADINAMATEYQDSISRLLDNMKRGEFLNI